MGAMCQCGGKMVGMTWATARPGEVLDHRLQLLISSAMLAEVRRVAGSRGVSASELIRQLIAEGLDAEDAGTR